MISDATKIQAGSFLDRQKVGHSKNKTADFAQLVSAKQENIKISNHAQKRIAARELELQKEDYHALSDALTELEQKGSKESLLVYKDVGLIADIHSRTIITAMGMNELHTVTNIDSAKFIK